MKYGKTKICHFLDATFYSKMHEKLIKYLLQKQSCLKLLYLCCHMCLLTTPALFPPLGIIQNNHEDSHPYWWSNLYKMWQNTSKWIIKKKLPNHTFKKSPFLHIKTCKRKVCHSALFTPSLFGNLQSQINMTHLCNN